MRHVFQSHSSTPNFVFSCGISGCIQTFKTFSAIQSHLQRKHSGCDFSQLESYTEEQSHLESQTEESSHHEEESETEESLRHEESEEDLTPSSAVSQFSEAKRSTALLLLTLKERHRQQLTFL